MRTSCDKLVKMYAKYFGYMTKMAATPIYGKNPLKNLLENQKADKLWTWFEALGMWGLLSLSKDGPRLTLTYLTSRLNLLPNAFKLENI